MLSKSDIHARFLLKRSDFNLDVDLRLSGSGVTVIQGQSGSGKTTLLRCIAGLEKPQDSFLSVNGVTWQDGSRFTPTHKRPIGYVFQEDSLFAHLTAKSNILFGCAQCTAIPSELMPTIELLGIGHLLNRKPNELSLGERQRVAIARAIAISPQLLLMDEPLASLDAQRKAEILAYIVRLKESTKTPIVYVTHDHSEAEKIGDEQVYLENGKVMASF